MIFGDPLPDPCGVSEWLKGVVKWSSILCKNSEHIASLMSLHQPDKTTISQNISYVSISQCFLYECDQQCMIWS